MQQQMKLGPHGFLALSHSPRPVSLRSHALASGPLPSLPAARLHWAQRQQLQQDLWQLGSQQLPHHLWLWH